MSSNIKELLKLIESVDRTQYDNVIDTIIDWCLKNKIGTAKTRELVSMIKEVYGEN